MNMITVFVFIGSLIVIHASAIQTTEMQINDIENKTEMNIFEKTNKRKLYSSEVENLSKIKNNGTVSSKPHEEYFNEDGEVKIILSDKNICDNVDKVKLCLQPGVLEYSGTQDVCLDLSINPKKTTTSHLMPLKIESSDLFSVDASDCEGTSLKIIKIEKGDCDENICFRQQSCHEIEPLYSHSSIIFYIHKFIEQTCLEELTIQSIDSEISKIIKAIKLDNLQFIECRSYLKNVSNEDNKCLQAILIGLSSFLISINEKKRLKIKENKKIEFFIHLALIKKLAKMLELINIEETKGSNGYNNFHKKPKYFYIFDLMHDLFIKMVDSTVGYENHLRLYKYLIFLIRDKRHDYVKKEVNFGPAIKHTISISIYSVLNIIFNLRIDIINTLTSKFKLLNFEKFISENKLIFENNDFFMGLFCYNGYKCDIFYFLNEYRKTIDFFNKDYSEITRKITNMKNDVSNLMGYIDGEYKKDSYFFTYKYVRSNKIMHFPRLYGLFLSSKIIEIQKMTHKVHYNHSRYDDAAKIMRRMKEK